MVVGGGVNICRHVNCFQDFRKNLRFQTHSFLRKACLLWYCEQVEFITQ